MEGSSTKTVYLRAGTYTLTGNLQLGSADNGETWQNYSGETPIIDGNNGNYRILLNNISNLTLWGLTFQNMAGGCTGSCGNLGAISGNPSNSVFQYNTFNNCTNACLMGGGWQSNTIANNQFNNLSPGIGPSGDNAAVWFYYGSSNNKVENNSFQNLQGGAVELTTGASDPAMNNNIVDRNYLNNIDTNAFTDGIGDIGALYIVDPSHNGTGNQFTNNVILNNCGSNYKSEECKAIYLDDEASNVTVTGNICQQCGTFALQIHGGDNNLIQNNIFDLSSSGTEMFFYQSDAGHPDYGMGNNVFTKNLVYTSGSASGLTLWNNQRSGSDANPTDTNNLYYAAGGGAWANSNPADTAPVYQNPQFTSPSVANYSMSASSPAYTMVGFQPLATNQGPANSSSSSSSATTSASGGTPASSGAAIANGAYTIRNNSSGLVLDDSGNAGPGAQVIQWPLKSPLAPNQTWIVTLVNAASGYYTIVNQSSGGYLTDTGSALYENSATNNTTQQWTITSGSGANVIRNVATGRVIDDPGFASAPDTGIITWPVNGGLNQGWIFQQAQ